MEGARKRSKGGFFHFFDWNGKSRKKLFSNNFELAEESKQGKNAESITKFRVHEIEVVDDRRPNSSNRESGDFSCASSVISDESYGTKAPGVVARLMGLDCLPTTSTAEASSTPFFVSSSVGESQYDQSTPNLRSEYNPMDYLNISSNQEKNSRNSLESKSQNVQNQPLKRFQTESLPPKSAKPISVTHHKLLSPIKNPGFVPKKNAAYIIEAAAKIIEASPKATSMNVKMPSIASSSVPLRIRDLKQKMEEAHAVSRPQRSKELCVAKSTRGQHSDKRHSGSEVVPLPSSKASMSSEKSASNSLRSKGKSASVTVQVKSKVQRKESTNSSNNSVKKQKEISSNQSIKSLPASTQKTKRTSESRATNVLRQNNQKQNSVCGKESSTLKKPVPNQPGRKAQCTNGPVAQTGTISKAVLKPETLSRNMRTTATDFGKDKQNNISRKKPSVSDDLQISKNVSDVSSNGDDRTIKCNVAVEGSTNTSVDNRKNSMDVVSFTFTSPVKKAYPNPQATMMGKTNSSAVDYCHMNNYPLSTKSISSFSGLNIIAGDALGALLEQKLQELSNKVESFGCNSVRDETADSLTSSLQDSASVCNVISTIPAADDRKFQIAENDNLDQRDKFDCFLEENPRVIEKPNLQESEECPTPVSILEPSFESGSCSTTNVQSDDIFNVFSRNQSFEEERETELSDSASSISIIDMGRKHETRGTEFSEPSVWELDYIKYVLNNADHKLKEYYALENHFCNLEKQRNELKSSNEEQQESFKLWRKILFDCVTERLDLICQRTFVGSYKSWEKLCTLFQRNGWWLAEEIYKEITSWRRMGDLMVDELVDKDMSTQYGKWVDFNVEAFEEGVKIEKGILTSMIDELVSDLFFL